MCGLVGSVIFDGCSNIIKPETINTMRDLIAHRGPDHAETWVSQDGKVGLGHRRLSIIDLSQEANQPFSNNDKSIWVVFNGEIYNHLQLRDELKALGVEQWKSHHSDTEVIVKAYEQWGIKSVEKFIGMFAFALWDENEKCVWLVRDRIGIKPLYYTFDRSRLLFASEIKAILADQSVSRDVNKKALYHYLSFLTVPAPDTMFQNIFKVPPATCIKINQTGEAEHKKYWNLWHNTRQLSDKSENEIADLILENLRESVKLRKTGDVPVGVFLSGGIDSSTNAALFTEEEKKKVKAFTIGYKGSNKSYKNETEYARQVAQDVNADYFEKLLEMDDLINFLPKMVYLQDEPLADPVCVPVYYVSKLARENNVSVCQVGEGADELFWGYYSWKVLLMLQKANDYKPFNALKKIGLKVLKTFGYDTTIYYEWLKRGAEKKPVFWSGAEAFTETEKKKLLSQKTKNELGEMSSFSVIEPIYKDFLKNAHEVSHLNWMSYADLCLRLPELLLMRVDKMSMGVSLEARVPFLDHKFVELAMSVPSKLKSKKNISKYILKKAVSNIIPQEIINRKKQGFAVPVYDWFFDKLGVKTEQELKSFCKQTDFFDFEYIQHLINTRQTKKVWYLLNFALWWRTYIARTELKPLEDW